MQYLQLLEIRPGGWLLLSILYFFGDLEGLAVILGSAAVHEAGHLLMLRRFGVYIRAVTLDITGLCIQYNGLYLSALREFLAAVTGPAAGLSAALIASVMGNIMKNDTILLFAGVGAALSLFNLLPAKPLDGWRMVNAFFPRAARLLGFITALVVLMTGIAVMLGGYGTALAFMGVILLGWDAPVPGRIRK